MNASSENPHHPLPGDPFGERIGSVVGPGDEPRIEALLRRLRTGG